MSDHRERSCTECGSLLHHEANCPTRACAECTYLRDNCVCDTGFKLTPVPVTQVPDEVPECPPEQFEMKHRPHMTAAEQDAMDEIIVTKAASPGLSTTIADRAATEYFPLKCLTHGITYRNMCPENAVGELRCREVPNVREGVLKGAPEKPVRTARVSSVSFASLMGDTPEEAPAEATIVIPEGHGTLADPGPAPIKPDPKRELEEITNPSLLPEAEVPVWLRRAREEDKFRKSSPLAQESPDGLLYEVVPQEALRMLAAGASGHAMNHKLADLVRTGRALTMLARELHAMRHQAVDVVEVIQSPALLKMACGAEVTAAEAYSHELCEKCNPKVIIESTPHPAASPVKEMWDKAKPFKRHVDIDPADKRGYTPQHVWPDRTLLPANENRDQFVQEYCNVPVGHVEMPCGRILKDEAASFHTDCTECSDVLFKTDGDVALTDLRMRIHDKITEWDDSEGLILEDTVPQVVDFVMTLLGLEVLSCAFCGETYEGEKPVPRAALAGHVRQCKSHPLKHAIDHLRARVREKTTEGLRWWHVVESIAMSVGVDAHHSQDSDRVEQQILAKIHEPHGEPKPQTQRDMELCLRCRSNRPLNRVGYCPECWR